MFRLGMEPTGSKDPFALRRAANSIVRILAESSLPLWLSDVINASTQAQDTEAKILAFFTERIDFYLREGRDQAYDVVKAVMAAGHNDLRDLVARAEAVTAMRGSEDFLAVSAAFKRMKNILTQAHAKGDIPPAIVDHDLLLDPAEKLLAVTASAAASAIQELQAERNYGEALRVIAALRPSIDDWFDKVMVMVPEDDIRANRLALLNRTLNDLSRIADFSEIVTAG
jgi:glycyl-tRNA synthetase beta chain